MGPGMFGAPLGGNTQPQPQMPSLVPMSQPPLPQQKPSLFGQGGVGRDIAGSIGDYLLQQAHAQPIFAPAQQDQRKMQYQQQQLAAQKDAAWKQWVAQQQYKAANPDPTSFQQDLQAAGIDPNSERGHALYQQRVTNLADPVQAIPGVDAQGNHVLYQMRSSQMGGQQQSGPPQAAIDYLTKNPNTAAMFDQKYGPGASQRFLSGGAPSQGGATFP